MVHTDIILLLPEDGSCISYAVDHCNTLLIPVKAVVFYGSLFSMFSIKRLYHEAEWSFDLKKINQNKKVKNMVIQSVLRR